MGSPAPKTSRTAFPSAKYGWGGFRKITKSSAFLGRSRFLNPGFWNNGTLRMTQEFLDATGIRCPVGTEVTIYKVKLGDTGFQIGFNEFVNGVRHRVSMMIADSNKMLLLRWAFHKRSPWYMDPTDIKEFLHLAREARKAGCEEFTFCKKTYYVFEGDV